MRRSRGFTLIEAVVSVLILSVVMVVALTLLVSMRSFAAKQQTFTVPRQAARSAVDYMSFFAAGATDLNVAAGNPNALVVWTSFGDNVSSLAPAAARQTSFNNLSGADAALGYGDAGTDIISLSVATNPVRIPVVVGTWTGNDPLDNSAGLNFTVGCPSDVTNLDAFKAATGATGAVGSEVSGLLTVQDPEGRWRYLRISRYVASTCASGTDNTVQVEFVPVTTAQLNPPGGWRGDLAGLLTLNAGVDYTSFRVRNRNLEQKTSGIFNPNCDKSAPTPALGEVCPATGFTPVVENVEDLQVAYVYQNGTVWNTAAPGQVLATTGTVPSQARTVPLATPPLTDVTNVRGLRISVIARSNPLDIGARGLSSALSAGRFRRRALEDHPQGPVDTIAGGVFDRYRLTTTLVLRNRLLGF